MCTCAGGGISRIPPLFSSKPALGQKSEAHTCPSLCPSAAPWSPGAWRYLPMLRHRTEQVGYHGCPFIRGQMCSTFFSPAFCAISCCIFARFFFIFPVFSSFFWFSSKLFVSSRRFFFYLEKKMFCTVKMLPPTLFLPPTHNA